ncbi:MAG: GtrA family protein [Atopobiaceae bacterium]|nr:GtrA family protein [Atopobiaceae bacterium]
MKGVLKQFTRFAVVGVSAFAIDFVLLVILTSFVGLHPILSAAISFVVSLVYNYMASMRFVYARRDDLSRRREFTTFSVLATIGLILNELIMWLGEVLVLNFGVSPVSYVKDNYYMVVKLASAVIVSLWNFLSRRRWLDANHVSRLQS